MDITYTKLGDISYGDLCYLTLPCQHNVILHSDIDPSSTKPIWSGVKIYGYCIDNNIKVPEHFAYCKKYYDQNINNNSSSYNDSALDCDDEIDEIDEIEKNNVAGQDSILNHPDLIDENSIMIEKLSNLIKEKNLTIDKSYIIDLKKEYDLADKKKIRPDIGNAYCTKTLCSDGGSITKYGRVDLTKYEQIEYKIGLNIGSDHDSYHKKLLELLNFSVDKLVSNRLSGDNIYDKSDAALFYSTKLFDILNNRGLILNGSAVVETNVQIISNDNNNNNDNDNDNDNNKNNDNDNDNNNDNDKNVDQNMIRIKKIDPMVYLTMIESAIVPIIYDNHQNRDEIFVKLEGLPYLNLKSASFKITFDKDIDVQVCLHDYNNLPYYLEKTANAKYIFSPVEPIPLWLSVFQQPTFIIKLGKKFDCDIFITKFCADFCFEDDPTTDPYKIHRRQIDSLTSCTVMNGCYMFNQNKVDQIEVHNTNDMGKRYIELYPVSKLYVKMVDKFLPNPGKNFHFAITINNKIYSHTNKFKIYNIKYNGLCLELDIDIPKCGHLVNFNIYYFFSDQIVDNVNNILLEKLKSDLIDRIIYAHQLSQD